MSLKTIQRSFLKYLFPPEIPKYFVIFFLSISVFRILEYLFFRRYVTVNDKHYYLAIAKGFLETGSIRDFTLFPSQPILTPQLGASFEYLVLKLFDISDQNAIISLSVFHWLIGILGFYWLIKCCILLGIQKKSYLIFISTLYFINFNFWNFQIEAGIDSVFITGSFFLCWFYLKQLYQSSNMKAQIGILIFSAILVHFRLNAIFIPLAMFFAILLSQNMKQQFELFRFCFLALLINLLSLTVFKVFPIDFSGIEETTDMLLHFTGSIDYYALFFQDYLTLLPINKLNVYLVILTSLILLTQTLGALLKRQIGRLFVLFLLLGSWIFTQLVFGNGGPRYIIATFPFLFIVLLSSSHFVVHFYGLLLGFLVILGSSLAFFNQVDLSQDQTLNGFYYYLDKKALKADSSVVLRSSIPRSSSVFIGLPHELDMRRALSHDHPPRRTIWIVGDEAFTQRNINEVKSIEFEIVEMSNLTKDFLNPSGLNVTELKVRPKPTPEPAHANSEMKE